MKITVQIGDTHWKAHLPYDGAAHVVVDDYVQCPNCGWRPPTVLGILTGIKVHGRHQRIESRDTYRSEAISICCDQVVGVIRVQMSTIFGIEEDERVLNGPWRVY